MNSHQVNSIEGIKVFSSAQFSDFRGRFKKFQPLEILDGSLDTVAVSHNPTMGTIRGLHFQIEPFAEKKIITCLQGTIFDVAVDLRIESQTFGKWMAVQLDSEKGDQIFLPKGIAHGFQTLEPNSIVHYSISSKYSEQAAITINPFGDLRIDWPLPHTLVSERDLNGLTLELASSRYSESLIK